jgi:hypothetical protein
VDEAAVYQKYLQLIRLKGEALHRGDNQAAERAEDLLDDLYRCNPSPVLRLLRNPERAPR